MNEDNRQYQADQRTLWGRTRRIGRAVIYCLGEIDQATGAYGIRDDFKRIGGWVAGWFKRQPAPVDRFPPQENEDDASQEV